METAKQDDREQENGAEISVYATGEHKRECAQRFLDGSYLFKAALRDFRDLCKEYQFDFEDRAAWFADLVNREP